MNYQNLVDELSQTNGSIMEKTTFEAFQTIHRIPCSYIEFFKKFRMPGIDSTIQTSYYKYVYTSRVSDLSVQLPQIAPILSEDGYFTVNSFEKPIVKDLGKDLFTISEWHQVKQASFLNSCVADLDVGRPRDRNFSRRQSWEEALLKIIAMTEENRLPKASIIVKTGRGLNILWLLRDEKIENSPPMVSPEKLKLYREVNVAIINRLSDMGADKLANTESKLLRIPNTIHTLADKKVKYVILKGIDGNCPYYTLDELAVFFNT